MAGVLIKVKSLYKNLPKAEKYIADYILRHPEKVPFLSVSELAEATNVSVASVSRLSKKLGCENFRDFKIELAQVTSESNIGAIYQAITPDDGDKEIIEKVFLGNIKSLQDTLKIIDRRELLQAARAISKCSKVVFFGIGSSGHIAMDAALRFTLLDIQADAYNDPQQMLIQALRMKKSEVAVGFSHSGRSKITIEAIKCAGENGSTTIGVSNYLESPLHAVSNVFICTSFSESRVKVAALSSRIAQMCILDAMYLLVAHYKKTFNKAELFNGYAEKFLRVPEK
ncbi:MAG: MurR/RpiR family transcriptional regulator [Planctomycetota bacterium]